MKKLIAWFLRSNRYKHLLGGLFIGAFSNSDYCAAYAGIGVAAALELKDRQWGGEWDWTDFALTVTGVVVARLAVSLIQGA